jgi:succinyl-diaminopimelate desuccinylase
MCIVGEPSSSILIGDTIKNGRRGSLTGSITVYGVQGHVAYPEMVKNPIHLAIPAIKELIDKEWDKGSVFFPKTSFQIVNVKAGNGASNVVPSTLNVECNFRYSDKVTANELTYETEKIFRNHKLKYTMNWTHSGEPFLTKNGKLLEFCKKSIYDNTGIVTRLSTSGGTSDGRFIAPTGAQVVELGLCNDTIHKVNECVKVSDLEKLARIYLGIMIGLL